MSRVPKFLIVENVCKCFPTSHILTNPLYIEIACLHPQHLQQSMGSLIIYQRSFPYLSCQALKFHHPICKSEMSSEQCERKSIVCRHVQHAVRIHQSLKSLKLMNSTDLTCISFLAALSRCLRVGLVAALLVGLPNRKHDGRI